MKKSNKKFETIEDILRRLDLVPPWMESRGRKWKYFFHTMRKGEIIKKAVSLKKARAIQCAMKHAANRQGFDVSIQNKGSFLLIRRNR